MEGLHEELRLQLVDSASMGKTKGKYKRTERKHGTHFMDTSFDIC